MISIARQEDYSCRSRPAVHQPANWYTLGFTAALTGSYDTLKSLDLRKT